MFYKLRNKIDSKRFSKVDIPIKNRNEWLVKDDTGKFHYYSDTTEAFSDYCGRSLYYTFEINGEHGHQHNFNAVLYDLYHFPEGFELNDKDKKLYTEAQLELINSVKKKLLSDGLKDLGVREEYIKRGMNPDKYL